MNPCLRVTSLLMTLCLPLAVTAADDSAADSVSAASEVASASEQPIRIVSFSLIDTRTNKPVKAFEKITKDSTIAISKLPSARINVRANVSGRPASVRFSVPEKKLNRVENKAPYSLAGDLFGRFLPWNATPGTYTLEAIPYASRSGRGQRGEKLRIKVRFTE